MKPQLHLFVSYFATTASTGQVSGGGLGDKAPGSSEDLVFSGEALFSPGILQYQNDQKQQDYLYF